jgi:hypothetical protein
MSKTLFFILINSKYFLKKNTSYFPIEIHLFRQYGKIMSGNNKLFHNKVDLSFYVTYE